MLRSPTARPPPAPRAQKAKPSERSLLPSEPLPARRPHKAKPSGRSQPPSGPPLSATRAKSETIRVCIAFVQASPGAARAKSETTRALTASVQAAPGDLGQDVASPYRRATRLKRPPPRGNGARLSPVTTQPKTCGKSSSQNISKKISQRNFRGIKKISI